MTGSNEGVEPDTAMQAGIEPDRAATPDGFIVIVGSGDKIHFLDWGGPDGERPGIVLVHGLSATSWVWAPVARRLRRMRRTVAIDLPGHGLSDAPTAVGAYAADALVEAITAVAEGAGLLPFGPPRAERRVLLVGHGFGGAAAALAAGTLGDRCAGLVLVDGGWERLAETTGMEPDEFLRTTEEPPEVLRSMDAYLADRRDFDPATWDDDQERAARAAVVELPVGRVVAAVRPHALKASVQAAFAYDPAEILPTVSAPITALLAVDNEAGAHSRALIQAQATQRAAGRPRIRTASFPTVGHNLMRYRPAEVTRAILDADLPASGDSREPGYDPPT